MKGYQKLGCFFLLLLLLIGVLYAASGLLISAVIKKTLQEAGFSEVVIVLTRPSFKRWRLQRLQATQANHARIHLENVSLNYDWFNLSQAKLSIEKMLVLLAEPSNEEKITLPRFAWPKLPLAHVVIQHFEIRLPTKEPMSAKGRFQWQQQALTLHLQLQQAELNRGYIELTLDKNGRMQAWIQQHDTQGKHDVLKSDMQWYLQDDSWQVEGQVALDLGLMLTGVQAWVTLPTPLQHVQGHLKASWQLTGSMVEPLNHLQGRLDTAGSLTLAANVAGFHESYLDLYAQARCQEARCDWTYLANNQMHTLWQGKQEVIPLSMKLLQPLQGKLSWLENDLNVQLLQGEVLLEPVKTNSFQWQSVQMKPRLSVQHRLAQGWQWLEADINVMLPTFQWQADAFSVQAQAVQLELGCKSMRCHWRIKPGALLQGHLDNTTLKVSFPQGVTGHLNASYLQVDAKQRWSLASFHMGDVQVSDSSLMLSEALQWRLGGQQQTLKLQWLNALLHWQDVSYASPSLQLKLKQAKDKWELTLDNPNFVLASEQLKDVTLQLQLQASMDSKRIKVKLDLQDDTGNFHLLADATHWLFLQQGVAHLNLLPIQFSEAKTLSDWLFLPQHTDIQSGSVAAQSKLAWASDQVSTHQTQLQLKQLSGMLLQKKFSGLHTLLSLQGDHQSLVTRKAARLRLAKLEAGIVLQDMLMDIAFQFEFVKKPSFQVNDVQVGVLGGSLLLPSLNIDLNRKKNPFQVQVQHIDLAKLVALRQEKDLFVTGLVSGLLPFDWTDQGLTLQQGKLYSDQGGKIRYLPKQVVESMGRNTQLHRLLNILDHFQYHTLTAGVSYQADGLMHAKLHLAGHNASFQDGHAIALNINLEENILQLMRSLQLADAIGDRLGERAGQLLQQ